MPRVFEEAFPGASLLVTMTADYKDVDLSVYTEEQLKEMGASLLRIRNRTYERERKRKQRKDKKNGKTN